MIKLKNLLKEVITIDVEIGDTILTGRFKNKKTVVKSIEKDEFGMPTINGRKIVSFRKMSKEKVSEDLKVDVAKKYGQNGFLVMLNNNGNTATKIFRDKKNFDKLRLNLRNQSDLKKLLYIKSDNKGFVKNENVILERIDFYEVANEVVKKHNLNSQVQFTTSKGSKADYNVDKDVITIKPTNDVKDFFESLLHEIHHAMMAKKLGKKNYISKYEMEMNLKAGEGKDPYDQNPYEIKAERYGKKYAPKWMKRLDVN